MQIPFPFIHAILCLSGAIFYVTYYISFNYTPPKLSIVMCGSFRLNEGYFATVKLSFQLLCLWIVQAERKLFCYRQTKLSIVMFVDRPG